MERWMQDAMFEFSLRRPQACSVLNGTLDCDPRAAMEELRVADPEGYANLSEFIVLDTGPGS